MRVRCTSTPGAVAAASGGGPSGINIFTTAEKRAPTELRAMTATKCGMAIRADMFCFSPRLHWGYLKRLSDLICLRSSGDNLLHRSLVWALFLFLTSSLGCLLHRPPSSRHSFLSAEFAETLCHRHISPS